LLPLTASAQWKEVERAAREVLAVDSKNYTATIRLSEALRALGRSGEANKLLKSFSRLYPSPLAMAVPKNAKLGGAFAESLRLERKGDKTGALKEVLQILDWDHNNYAANVRAGWLYYSRGDLSNAGVRYGRASALAPLAIEPKVGLLLTLVGSKRWMRAAPIARKILEKDPKNYSACSSLAYIEFSAMRYGKAARLYQRVLRLYPSDTQMQLGLGWTMFRQGNFGRAHKLFTKVLQVQPSNKGAKQGLKAIIAVI
jgi:tetratricopeptide (TPR) repeat protein